VVMEIGIPGADGESVVVSIVDDHPDSCHGVLARLPQENSSFVAGVMAATVPEFLVLEGAAARRSDVVLLDLTLKEGSSLGGKRCPAEGRRVSGGDLYGEERPERLQGTLGIRADAVVRKEEAERLEEALIAVMSGDHGWVSPLMAAVVLIAQGPRLSPAQVEVLRLYATGVTAQQIESLQGCALETVKSHLKAVKALYETQGEAVFTKTDMLQVALRDDHVGPDWYLSGR
jgi:two-component system, NarL family, nitrate/nitrite response regulator NarL